MKIHHKGDYAARRRAEYPEIGEQLDAVYKLASQLRARGEQMPPEVDLWIDAVDEVKKTYPKN